MTAADPTACPEGGNVLIHTDGACLGNPGPGGYGAILAWNGQEKELSQGYRLTTNNRMEMMAVIASLETLTKPCVVEVVTDSQYVRDAFEKRWLANWKRNGWKTADKKDVKNKDLWLRMDALMTGHKVKLTWVRGHSGHPENERCDVLARTAAQGRGLVEDGGYTGK